MRRLLGSVKFVLVGTKENANVTHPDVMWAKVDSTDYQQLEQVIEQIIDEGIATETRHSRPRRRQLAGSSAT
jgi:hypothetical protein